MSEKKIVINKTISFEQTQGVKLTDTMSEPEMDELARKIAGANGMVVTGGNWTDHTGTEKEYRVAPAPEPPPETKDQEQPEGSDPGLPKTVEQEMAESAAENLSEESVENAVGSLGTETPAPEQNSETVDSVPSTEAKPLSDLVGSVDAETKVVSVTAVDPVSKEQPAKASTPAPVNGKKKGGGK